jgi:putative endonuclease
MKDPKKEKNNRKTGGNYEQAAGFYLEQHGYQILQYNYRCRIGEIDIVAKEGENLVFCEVKYRTGPGKGSPLEAVDARKQRKIFCQSDTCPEGMCRRSGKISGISGA